MITQVFDVREKLEDYVKCVDKSIIVSNPGQTVW